MKNIFKMWVNFIYYYNNKIKLTKKVNFNSKLENMFKMSI